MYHVSVFGNIMCALSVPCVLCGCYDLCYVDHVPYINIEYSTFLVPFSSI